jgi:O-antigen/teichoic acid export membrane protein
MSTPVRILRGTSLAMGVVVANILGQIITVPIFLSHWNAETYGVWLIMLGAFGYVFLLSTAFHQYTYGEFLRVGAGALEEVRTVYRTSVAVSVCVSFCEIIVVMALTSRPIINWIYPENQASMLVESAVSLLQLYSVLNFLIMPINSITAQVNTLNGNFARVAFWALVNNVFCLVAATVAVLLGAGLWNAGLIYLLAHSASIILALIDMLRLASRSDILSPAPIIWRTGARSFAFSLVLAGRTFLESFRQHGFRLLLGAFVGPAAVTTLSTTRTLANVLHQGLATITAPVLPELMRYILERDQDRIEGALAVVWLTLFSFLVPGLLLLCLTSDQIFLFWTRGTLTFDSVLFLTLLLVVVAFAAIQPAVAILQGHNHVGWLMSASLLAAAVLAVLSIALIPMLGLRGAGLALLGAELCVMLVVLPGAICALRQRALLFPLRSFKLVFANLTVVGVLAMLAITVFKDWSIFFVLPLATNILFATFYWFSIPASARERICLLLDSLLARVLGVARATIGK